MLTHRAWLVMLCACTTAGPAPSPPVIAGGLDWSTRNLDRTHFNNGDPIPEVRDAEAWKEAGEAGQPAWCYYENSADNLRSYGRLYNWYAVHDPRGLAPQGWRVATRDEWATASAGLAKSGQFAQKAGFRHVHGNFRLGGLSGSWWTADLTDAKVTAWFWQTGVTGTSSLEEANAAPGTGLSVRVVREPAP